MIQNRELELLQAQGWRYCAIAPVNGQPTKGPRTPNWQKNPLTLDQVPADNNVGVILGPASGGILAIDFDGPWAWDCWEQLIGPTYGVALDSIKTVTWSSGRAGRAQFAFRVPEESWASLPARFQLTGPEGDDGTKQGLEFRWSTDSSVVQSVLPPSIHPDTQEPYFWINSPVDTEVMWAPPGILEWGQFGKARTEVDRSRSNRAVVLPTIDTLTQSTVDDIEDLLKKLKSKYFVLDYTTWRNVAWSVYRSVGVSAGRILMQQYYPEQNRGEYDGLMQGWDPSKSPGEGTLRYMVRDLLAAERQQLEQQYDDLLREAMKKLKMKNNE